MCLRKLKKILKLSLNNKKKYRMVKEALAERANLIHIAPHLSYPLPIMLPVYKYGHFDRFSPQQR
jgi:glycerol-3-phosphate dehydrogenase